MAWTAGLISYCASQEGEHGKALLAQVLYICRDVRKAGIAPVPIHRGHLHFTSH